jgi:hypothetical protein
MIETNIFQEIRLGNTEVYKNIINQLDVNICNDDKQTLLHEAVVYNRVYIAKDLISRGILLSTQDKKGQTVLHYAALHGNIEIAKLILDHGGDVNILDDYGNNALWVATFNARGDYDIVEMYKKAGGDSHNKNTHGKSALDFANQIGDKNLVSILS